MHHNIITGESEGREGWQRMFLTMFTGGQKTEEWQIHTGRCIFWY